ncbi:MAG: ROK family protein [Nitrospinae bacterium]|nr:ROK family protein [Nitrospinota bacterium]
MGKNDYVAGIDLGGTNIRTASVSFDGAILSRVKIETGAADGYKAVLERIVESVRSAASHTSGTLAAVGIAAPGAIDFTRGVVTRSPNFPDWRDAPLTNDLAAALKVPVELENDANAAAFGEGFAGAAKGWRDYIMFTLGTGVGSGVVLNGKVWRGPSGMAGEMGHITARPDGRKCGCGNNGCVEAYASASGVAATARERFNEPAAAWLQKASGGDASMIDAALVAKGAFENDPLCREMLEEAGECLGFALAAGALVLGVTRFVIGGGMAGALPVMENSIRNSAARRAYTIAGSGIEIVNASLGDDAGIIGAAAIAIGAMESLR